MSKYKGQPEVMPFIFARLTKESQMHVQHGGQAVIKDWVVKIAKMDLKPIDCAWMNDPELGTFCFVPDVDIQIGEDQIFATLAEARHYVANWFYDEYNSDES